MDRILTSEHSVYKFEYAIGNMVWLVTDPDQMPWQVTGILIKNYGHIFEITQCTDVEYVEPFQLQGEPTPEALL